MRSAALGWLSCSAADVPAGDAWLSRREQEALSELRFVSRRMDWRLGRWTAKRAVEAWLGGAAPTKPAEIVAADDGAPEAFVKGRPAPVCISLSHREGVAVCVVAASDTAIGCDLEAVEPRSEAFVHDFFTADERAGIEATLAEQRPLLANLVWSAKESALKALREGLRLDTRTVTVQLDVPLGSGAVWHPLQVIHAQGDTTFAGWWRRHGSQVLTVVAALPPACEPVALGTGKTGARLR